MSRNNPELEKAILEKITEMEKPGYVFPPAFKKRDYIISIAVILLCAAGLIWGYLSM